ncbi:MAG: hypothetical protein DMG75_15415 [Acidobacteria bacterium]|nr:MAG: hypothetical protein DMG75_15415 [Acidobacteriota bacterium]
MTPATRLHRIWTAMKKTTQLFMIWSVAILAVVGSAAGEQSSILNFLVVRETNGKPVRNASVILHPVNKHGKQERGGLQLKTDAEGKTSFDGAPYGKLRIQVLVPGFQTFGDDYDITGPVTNITVKLKRPQEQYTIYGDQQNSKKDEKKDDAQKPQ